MFNSLPTRSNGDRLEKADVEGHVLVIDPVEYVESITTTHGDSDAIKLNVYDVTDKKNYEDVLWFGAIVGTFKQAVGGRVLVRIKKGEAKPGKSAPWIAEDLTGSEKAVLAAQKYMTSLSGTTTKAKSEAELAADNLDDLDDL